LDWCAVLPLQVRQQKSMEVVLPFIHGRVDLKTNRDHAREVSAMRRMKGHSSQLVMGTRTSTCFSVMRCVTVSCLQ
jgi:hypothetical protein